MAFGLMAKRWSILKRPIAISIRNIKLLICSIGVLHNYFINELVVHCGGNAIFVPKNTNFSPEEMVLQKPAVEFDRDNFVYDFVTPHSNNREDIVTELETYGYTRKVV